MVAERGFLFRRPFAFKNTIWKQNVLFLFSGVVGSWTSHGDRALEKVKFPRMSKRNSERKMSRAVYFGGTEATVNVVTTNNQSWPSSAKSTALDADSESSIMFVSFPQRTHWHIWLNQGDESNCRVHRVSRTEIWTSDQQFIPETSLSE